MGFFSPFPPFILSRWRQKDIKKKKYFGTGVISARVSQLKRHLSFPTFLSFFDAGRFMRSTPGFWHLFSHQFFNESRASKSSLDSFQNNSPNSSIKLFGGHKGGQFQHSGPWGHFQGGAAMGQAQEERHRPELGLFLSPPVLMDGSHLPPAPPHPPKDPQHDWDLGIPMVTHKPLLKTSSLPCIAFLPSGNASHFPWHLLRSSL